MVNKDYHYRKIDGTSVTSSTLMILHDLSYN